MNGRETSLALADWGSAAKRRFTFSTPDVRALQRPGARTVVLLPGVWERWGSTWSWGEALFAAGFDVRFVPELDLTLGSLKDLSDQLLSFLDRQVLEPPIIVAHSKGGLVAKRAMISNPERITGLVACGTPFDGAPLARYTPPGLKMNDLAPEAEEIRDLAANTDVNRKIVLIEAEWDQDVPQAESFPCGFRCTVPVAGHHRLLIDPLTTERIVQFVIHIDKHW